MIHSTAVISKKANIHDEVKIGPFCVIDEGVTLDAGNELISHIRSEERRVGKEC